MCNFIYLKRIQKPLIIFCAELPNMTHFGPPKVHGFQVRMPICHIVPTIEKNGLHTFKRSAKF